MAQKYDEESVILIQAIHKVIEWLESLLDDNSFPLQTSPSSLGQRVFSNEECECLTLESRHYLLSLEKQGILTVSLLERIVYHAMLLDLKQIELPVIEGITRIVLGQRPDNGNLTNVNKVIPGSNSNIH